MSRCGCIPLLSLRLNGTKAELRANNRRHRKATKSDKKRQTALFSFCSLSSANSLCFLFLLYRFVSYRFVFSAERVFPTSRCSSDILMRALIEKPFTNLKSRLVRSTEKGASIAPSRLYRLCLSSLSRDLVQEQAHFSCEIQRNG